MSMMRTTCFASGIAIGAIRHLQESDSKTNPIIDYAVPAVGIAGIISGMRAVVKNTSNPKSKIPLGFGFGLIGGLIGGTILVYSGNLVGSAVVDVAKEYQRQNQLK